jgi:hypothetical protein
MGGPNGRPQWEAAVRPCGPAPVADAAALHKQAQLQELLSTPRRGRSFAPAPAQRQLQRSGRQSKGQSKGSKGQRRCIDTAWTWDGSRPHAFSRGQRGGERGGEAGEEASCPVPYRRLHNDTRPGRTESLCCPHREGAAASMPNPNPNPSPNPNPNPNPSPNPSPSPNPNPNPNPNQVPPHPCRRRGCARATDRRGCSRSSRPGCATAAWRSWATR